MLQKLIEIIAALLVAAGVYETKRQADLGDANNATWFQLLDNMKELCNGPAQQIQYGDRCGWGKIVPGNDVFTFIVTSDSSCDPRAQMITFLDDKINIYVAAGEQSTTMTASQAKGYIDDLLKSKKCEIDLNTTSTGSDLATGSDHIIDTPTPVDQGAGSE
jgi:hypothetical protein